MCLRLSETQTSFLGEGVVVIEPEALAYDEHDRAEVGGRVGRFSCGVCFFFSSRRRHTRWPRDWSSDVCSSDLMYSTPRWQPITAVAILARVSRCARAVRPMAATLIPVRWARRPSR